MSILRMNRQTVTRNPFDLQGRSPFESSWREDFVNNDVLSRRTCDQQIGARRPHGQHGAGNALDLAGSQRPTGPSGSRCGRRRCRPLRRGQSSRSGATASAAAAHR